MAKRVTDASRPPHPPESVSAGPVEGGDSDNKSREGTARVVGPERLIVLLYGLFVVAAGARSAVQLGADASRAPLAYSLSAVAAVVYAVGFVLVRRASVGVGVGAARRFAVAELAAVTAVGTISVIHPFAEPTVWTWFGAGYLFAPLFVPVGVLLWLREQGREPKP